MGAPDSHKYPGGPAFLVSLLTSLTLSLYMYSKDLLIK
jgi:hypothetical protein